MNRKWAKHMNVEPDRKDQITGAAIDIIAVEGIRTLTHRSVDKHLGLPEGSTSYYFRTRRDLLNGAVQQIQVRSRRDFESSEIRRPNHDIRLPQDLRRVARLIARSIDRLLAERRNDVLARFALSLELSHDAELHGLVARSFFSRDQARSLFTALGVPKTTAAADDFVKYVEGIVYSQVVGLVATPDAGTPKSVERLTDGIETFLRGAIAK